MTRTALKACYLNTSIEFLTPEPELFNSNLLSSEYLNCKTFNVDRAGIFNTFKENYSEFDLIINV